MELQFPTIDSLIRELLLLISLLATLGGNMLTNFSSSSKKRPHNLIKLFNEITIRLFLTYFTFFLTLIVVLIPETTNYKLKGVVLKIVICISLSIGSFVLACVAVGFTNIFNKDETLRNFHNCTITENRCTVGITSEAYSGNWELIKWVDRQIRIYKVDFPFVFKINIVNFLLSFVWLLIVSFLLLFTNLIEAKSVEVESTKQPSKDISIAQPSSTINEKNILQELKK